MAEGTQRRLAAIVATDVVGYSRLVRADEEGAITALKALRADLIDPKLAEHNGRIVKLMGDGMLAEFPSVVDAVRAAVAIQAALAEHNGEFPEDKRLEFRVGINLGDVVIDGDDIHGDGVNVAARLEAMAEPGGICISGMVYEGVRDRIDEPFDDLGEQEVKNIARPVRVWKWSPTASGKAGRVITEEPLPLPDKPSIAVLPFENMSGDPEQDYFADGMAEDILTALSSVRWLFVIARNSSFIYKGRAVDVKQVGRELGVRYVLEGSVRKAGQRVRVTAQLIEAESGNHVWADRFDASTEDIFALQDELTAKIVGALGPEMTLAEIERRRYREPANFDAWDFYLQALPHHYAMTKQGFEEAIALLNKSIGKDPKFASAYALLGICYADAALHGWAGRSRDSRQIALENARKAVELDSLNALGYMALGHAYHVHGPMDEAIAAAQRALELEPSNAQHWRALSSALGFAGRSEEALSALEKAIRGSPRDPDYWYTLLAKASAHFVGGNLEDALREAKQAARLQPNFYACRAFVAAPAALLGRDDEARQAAQALLKLVPRFSIAAMYRNPMFERSEDLERMVEGFRRAGIPEE